MVVLGILEEEAVEILITQIIIIQEEVVVAVAIIMIVIEAEVVARTVDLGEAAEEMVDLGQTIHRQRVVTIVWIVIVDLTGLHKVTQIMIQEIAILVR